jgi:hypothetical protein
LSEFEAIAELSSGLNEQVKRNARRFAENFMFQVPDEETKVERSISTFNPFAVTERGAVQAANVPNSERAIEMGIFVVRAFIELRERHASTHGRICRADAPGVITLLATTEVLWEFDAPSRDIGKQKAPGLASRRLFHFAVTARCAVSIRPN